MQSLANMNSGQDRQANDVSGRCKLEKPTDLMFSLPISCNSFREAKKVSWNCSKESEPQFRTSRPGQQEQQGQKTALITDELATLQHSRTLMHATMA